MAETASGQPASPAPQEARTYGACGVPDCDECWPTYNEANEPITDNFGGPL